MKNTAEKDRLVKRIIVIEGMANLVVLSAKLVVGFGTGSLAILGDAIHSFTDVTNNIVAWIVIRLSAQPADREHPYGHRKFETLAVFGLAALLAALAFELALRALQNQQRGVDSEAWELWVMVGVLVTNVAVAAWERAWARRLGSDILLADASHTLADVLTTTVVIAGWQLSAAGYAWLDRVCALGVAGLVLHLAYKLFKRAAPVLVDEFAIDPEALTRAVDGVAGVERVVQVRSRWMGPTRAVDMIVTVDPKLSTEQSHHIADRIEDLLQRRFGVQDISIHVEPDEHG